MAWMELLEALSYGVTILGFPLAIGVFVYQQRDRSPTTATASAPGS